jgi:hypothetical protein
MRIYATYLFCFLPPALAWGPEHRFLFPGVLILLDVRVDDMSEQGV